MPATVYTISILTLLYGSGVYVMSNEAYFLDSIEALPKL